MDLDETWHVRWRPKKTKPCTFPVKSRYGFWREREKWVAEALFFRDLSDAPLLPLSLDRFRPNFPRTRVQVVAHDTWFHIPEKFPLRGRISPQNVFLGYKGYPICEQATGREKRYVTPRLFPSPGGHPPDMPYLDDFCDHFSAIHVRTSCCAMVLAMGNWAYVTPPGKRRNTNQ